LFPKFTVVELHIVVPVEGFVLEIVLEIAVVLAQALVLEIVVLSVQALDLGIALGKAQLVGCILQENAPNFGREIALEFVPQIEPDFDLDIVVDLGFAYAPDFDYAPGFDYAPDFVQEYIDQFVD
jgi:hypothetical protein